MTAHREVPLRRVWLCAAALTVVAAGLTFAVYFVGIGLVEGRWTTSRRSGWNPFLEEQRRDVVVTSISVGILAAFAVLVKLKADLQKCRMERSIADARVRRGDRVR